MATILTLAGGVLGFISAMVSMFALGFGVLAAFALWSTVGIAFCVAGVAVMMMPDRDQTGPVGETV